MSGGASLKLAEGFADQQPRVTRSISNCPLSSRVGGCCHRVKNWPGSLILFPPRSRSHIDQRHAPQQSAAEIVVVPDFERLSGCGATHHSALNHDSPIDPWPTFKHNVAG